MAAAAAPADGLADGALEVKNEYGVQFGWLRSGYNNKDALLSQTWVIAKSHGSEGPYGPLRRTLHFRVTTPACLLV